MLDLKRIFEGHEDVNLEVKAGQGGIVYGKHILLLRIHLGE